MSELNPKISKTLEFDKVRQQLAGFTSTERGKMELQRLQPLHNVLEVETLQDQTEEGRKAIRLRGKIPVPQLVDIQLHLKRLRIGGDLNGKEIAQIARVLTTVRDLVRYFEWFHEQEIDMHHLYLWEARLVDLPDVRKRISQAISDEGEVLSDASSELKRIRHAIRTNETGIRTKLDAIIRGSKATYLSDTLVTIRNDRFVIPVKQEYRNAFGGVVHDQSSTGQTLFIEPQAVLEMNNALNALRVSERQEIERILAELSAELAPHVGELTQNQEVLTFFDIVNAKALYADAIRATKPRISSENHVALWQARHPLINPDSVVANDILIGEEYQAIIITGPNTGGKTIALKTMGIIQLMAQSGLAIPANENSQVGIFTEIFADIGDEQSIEQSLSTFSSHMTNIVSIMNQIDEQSLVLLDEVGSGTDPQEGASLAIAILDYIGSKGSTVMATTHYPELKAYAYHRPGTINASMEFDSVSLEPTYRLQIGVPGRSNAFDISRRLGLPEQIIQQASSYIDEDSQSLNEMIADLEQKRRRVEQERLDLESQVHESDRLHRDLQKATEAFEESKEKALLDAKKEANKLVEEARLEAELLMQEIRDLQTRAGSNAQVKEHELIDLRKQFSDLVQDETVSNNKVLRKAKEKKRLKAGDDVLTASYGQRGTLLEQVDDGQWVVQMGIMKIKLPESDLTKIEEQKTPERKRKNRNVTRVSIASESHVNPQLDLRGKRYEEAMAELDRYIDMALLANYPQVTIVHGKGTGAIRQGVTTFLRSHRQVSSFEFAPPNAGGDGATIVTFK